MKTTTKAELTEAGNAVLAARASGDRAAILAAEKHYVTLQAIRMGLVK